MRPQGLRRALAGLLRAPVTVVGMGNPMRGDDAFGPLLAGKLAGRVGATVIDAEDIPESYLCAVIDGRPGTVLFLDAVDLGAAPGTAALLDADSISSYVASTHRAPLSMLMEIVRRETGARVAALAVQPRATELGQPPGPDVVASVACLQELLVALLPPRGCRETSRVGGRGARRGLERRRPETGWVGWGEGEGDSTSRRGCPRTSPCSAHEAPARSGDPRGTPARRGEGAEFTSAPRGGRETSPEKRLSAGSSPRLGRRARARVEGTASW